VRCAQGAKSAIDDCLVVVIVELCMVSHMPMLPRYAQPTVAIVTLLYCEKTAVDALIDYKTTYIRCKKGGHILPTFLAAIMSNLN